MTRGEMQGLLDALAADCREAEAFERHCEAATGRPWDRAAWAELTSDPAMARSVQMAMYAGMGRLAEHIRCQIERRGKKERGHIHAD